MLKLEKLVSHLQIFYTDNKFLRRVNQENPWPRQTVYLDYASWKHLWKHFRKTFWRRLEDVLKTSWRRLEDVLKTFLQDVLKTSWRRMAMTNILVLIKTSWRRVEDVFWRRMAKTNIFVLMKTSWKRLGDVFRRRRRKTSSKRLQDAFIKTNVSWANYNDKLNSDWNNRFAHSCWWFKQRRCFWKSDTTKTLFDSIKKQGDFEIEEEEIEKFRP